jgi:hypothetical protein
LLQPRTLRRRDCSLWTRPRCPHLDTATLCCMAITASFGSQGRDYRHLRIWFPVRESAFGCLYTLTDPHTSNIVVGGLRISALTDVAYGGDVTYDMGTTMIWSLAQISTAIIVACCPLLRPLFEKVMPRRFTRVSPRQSPSQQSRKALITVQTRIDIRSSLSLEPTVATFHDGIQDSWTPSFDDGREAGIVPRFTSHCYV